MEKSAIIIGGGIGGLNTACLLCKEGYRVTVLEKHYTAGGGLHTFKRQGTVYETGIHYIGDFRPGGVLCKLYTYLGIYDRLKIKPLDKDAFDIVSVGEDGKKYPVSIGKKGFIAHWGEFFPEEKENIRRYTEALYAIADRFYLCNMRLPDTNIQDLLQNEEVSMPTGKFIARYIRNPKLQHLLAWNNALYGGDFDTTPVYIHAIINRLFIEDASRFVGGSQQLADAMCDMIREHGGEVICGDGVKEIVVTDRKVQYVVTEKGRRYEANQYVSALHPATTIDLLDQSQLTKAYCNRIHTMSNTYSTFTLFVKMKKNSFPYLNSNVYCVDKYEQIWNVGSYQPEEWPVGMMVMTPPESEEEEKYAAKVIINCIMNFEDVRRWEDSTVMQRGEEYKAFKKECQERILRKFERYFPGVREKIEYCFGASPLTIRDYTGSKEGSLYGYMKNCNNLAQSHISPRTKVQNLLLTGQNINLHGILGVPLNAVITVAEMTGGIEHLINKINQIQGSGYEEDGKQGVDDPFFMEPYLKSKIQNKEYEV